MAENIIGISTGGTTYEFRPLYIVDGYGSLNGNEAISLGYFSTVDGASLLVYLPGKDSDMDSLTVQFEISDDSMCINAYYHNRYLYWSDLKEGQVYEFICYEGAFYLTTDIPKTSIKYRDSKNQLQTLVIGEDPNIDLSGGVYYATTSATATRVANSLILTDAGGNVCEYNGSRSFDLSDGVNYAEHAAMADEAGTATHAATSDYATSAGRANNADYSTDAGYADRAEIADSAHCASRLKEYEDRIPGEHISGEYCHICSIDIDGLGGRDNYSILFTGYGYEGVSSAPWGGMLYFEWNEAGTEEPSASAKWMSLTRADLSNSILLTIEGDTLLHVWFAYSNTYASANVTLIKGSNVNFNIYTTGGLIGSTIATSTFDGGGSVDLHYQILNDSGSSVWGSSFDFEKVPFIFRPGPNIDIYPTHALDSTHKCGVFIKLSDDFTQAFTQLQQYVELLQYTVANQKQQIADLKSVLTEITTGKTWDDNIWGSTAGQGATSGIMTNEHGFIDIHPL